MDNESYQIFDNIHTGGIRNAIWSRYDTEIISVGYDQSCAITDTRTGLLINRFKHDQILSSVCNNPKDDNLIVVGSKHMVLSWDKREDPNKKPCKMYKSVIGQVIRNFISKIFLIFKFSFTKNRFKIFYS